MGNAPDHEIVSIVLMLISDSIILQEQLQKCGWNIFVTATRRNLLGEDYHRLLSHVISTNTRRHIVLWLELPGAGTASGTNRDARVGHNL